MHLQYTGNFPLSRYFFHIPNLICQQFPTCFFFTRIFFSPTLTNFHFLENCNVISLCSDFFHGPNLANLHLRAICIMTGGCRQIFHSPELTNLDLPAICNVIWIWWQFPRYFPFTRNFKCDFPLFRFFP